MEGERWNGAPQEWDGYRIPGPRGQHDGFEGDPLTAALPYGLNDAGNPLATAAARESARQPLEEPTGAVAPVSPRPAGTAAFSPSAAQGGYAVELGLTIADPSTTPGLEPPPVAPPVGQPVGQPVTPPVAPPQPEPARFHAEPIDRASLRRPSAPLAPVGGGVFRTRRPAAAL
ncbi:hypothetical protein K1W54_42370, partial [Micromonospora sp. CPCC 205371]|nr:hypothetical protein [Micromonospora sp. CPCC 205371]